MENSRDRGREKKVNLVSSRGETSVFIDAEIDREGNLVLSGCDIGKAPKDWFGDSDYEYWLVVQASDKNRVFSILHGLAGGEEQFRPAEDVSEEERDWRLLALIEKLYRGDLRVVSSFRDLLTANGVRFEFSTY